MFKVIILNDINIQRRAIKNTKQDVNILQRQIEREREEKQFG